MRVLQLADVVNRHDFIDVIVEHADRSRFEMSVATFGRPPNIADPDYARRGVPCDDLGARAGRRSYPRALGRLRHLLSHRQIDLVHCHHYDPAVLAWLATRRSPVRYVVGRHYSDAIELNTTGLRRRAYLALERRVTAAAASTIVPSTMIAGLVGANGGRPDRVHLVPYAFVPAKYEHARSGDTTAARRSVGLGVDDFVVGTFARLYADKGHRYLLDAMAELVPACPDVRWLVVGDGAERASLEARVRAAGLGHRVTLAGWRHDAVDLMAATDLVVQPTLQEAFSQVMGEAMWLGRPLVITDVSGGNALGIGMAARLSRLTRSAMPRSSQKGASSISAPVISVSVRGVSVHGASSTSGSSTFPPSGSRVESDAQSSSPTPRSTGSGTTGRARSR